MDRFAREAHVRAATGKERFRTDRAPSITNIALVTPGALPSGRASFTTDAESEPALGRRLGSRAQVRSSERSEPSRVQTRRPGSDSASVQVRSHAR